MITASDPKTRTPHHSSSEAAPKQNPGTADAPTTPEQFAAPGPVTVVQVHNSVTPGTVWMEATNPASVAIATGANSVYCNLPAQGAGQLLSQLTQPIAALVLAPTVVSLGSLTQAQTGMSAQGFPGFPAPVSSTSALPAGCCITGVTINTGVSPPQAVWNFVASGAGTIAAGSRWLLFSLTGV